jgi:hypothetical protein
MKMIAINKHSSKLKDSSVEMPNAPYLNRWATCKNATAQIAHLVFTDTQNTNPKKPKELFSANARTNDD